MNGAAWERQIRYTLDVTRHYHNLLKLEEGQGRKDQTFYWDGNVAAMEEDGLESYYLQDDLGSPMQLLDENGEIRESYGFDEFGMSLFPEEDPGHQVQPFGYTGYQMEEAGGVYYAQARRYDARTGRFVSEDKIKGFPVMPCTLNPYTYCWNRPTDHVDLDGRFPWLVIPIVLGVVMLTGCNTVEEDVDEVLYVMPEPGGHEYKYTADVYNSDEYRERTNCYAYAFDLINNPVTGKAFYSAKDNMDSYGVLPFANQPGLISGQYSYNDRSTVSGSDDGNRKLVNWVKDDAEMLGLNFQEYQPDMSGGYAVLLVVEPYADYHWYRQETDGTWSHKLGWEKVTTGVTDPIQDAKELGYTTIVGYYYITEACDAN